MMRRDSLARVLDASSALLFDFDGPICKVFTGFPASVVAGKLARLVADQDPSLGAKLTGTGDPLEVLRLTHSARPELTRRAEIALLDAELEAVRIAGDPVDGAANALRAAQGSGRQVAVVSNNSADCVRAFLERFDLLPYVDQVVGRAPHHPELMKPHPYAVIQATRELSIDAKSCVMIGDSVTDIEAAHAAGSLAIGFANKPHKHALLRRAEADVITDRMQSIADALSHAGA